MASILQRVSKEWKRALRRFQQAPRNAAERWAEWQSRHQPFELQFHQGQNYRWSDATFWQQWDEVFGQFMALPKDFFCRGEVLLDVGCGSRPVLDWFSGASERHFLDPLLDQYREIPQ